MTNSADSGYSPVTGYVVSSGKQDSLLLPLQFSSVLSPTPLHTHTHTRHSCLASPSPSHCLLSPLLYGERRKEGEQRQGSGVCACACAYAKPFSKSDMKDQNKSAVCRWGCFLVRLSSLFTFFYVGVATYAAVRLPR